LTIPKQNTESIVGYDARENWYTLQDAWNEQRQQGFLYRLDIVKPLSVDTRVWPTIFESEQRNDPPDRFGVLTTWSDLAALRAAVTREYQAAPMRAWRMIAITIVLGPYLEKDAEPWTRPLPPVSPPELDPSWVFLGFDVADQWLLSVLSNCGFVPGLDDVEGLRAAWGPRLNQFHLFPRLDDAIEFKRVSDQRLAGEHAPSYVFGLWMIK
jgi:hypothetical protein